MPSSALLSVLYLARNGCENVDEQQAHHKYEDKSEIILKKGGEGGEGKKMKKNVAWNYVKESSCRYDRFVWVRKLIETQEERIFSDFVIFLISCSCHIQ